jgi:4-amino-4-deoxy-L-arabinose transferase-like glycosyltransferase
MNNAAQLLIGEPPLVANHHAVRLAFQAYLAAGMALFGMKTEVCQTLGIVTFASTAIVLFFLVRMLSSTRPALLAVFLFVLLPLDMIHSTAVLPDTFMTLLALLSIFFYLRARIQISRNWQFALAIACGLLLGLATSTKEPAAFLGIAFAIHLAATEPDVSRWIVILGGIVTGAVMVFAAEADAFYLWTGNALLRFHVSSQTYGHEGWFRNDFSLRQCSFYILQCFNSLGEFGIHGYLLLLGGILAINRRSGATSLALIACAVLATYLSIGSISVKRFVLIPHQTRYFHTVLVIGCILMGIAFYETGRNLRMKLVVGVLAGALVAVASILAAKQKPWRGSVPLAKWLDNPEHVRNAELYLLTSFVAKQALENRKVVQRFPTVSVRKSWSGNTDTIHILPEQIDSLPAGSGIVVDRFRWVTPLGEEDLEQIELELPRYPRRSFREEKIYGTAWPPYKGWIGVGEQRNMIGRIWWAGEAPTK